MNTALHQQEPAPYVTTPAALPGSDELIIAKALEILEGRMRKPGQKMDSVADVRAFLTLKLAELEREVFAVLFLDAQHCVISYDEMFQGTLSQTSVYPREVLRRAMTLNAHSVILAHNHPSGTPEPSRADEIITKSLQSTLALADVRVLDHFIVGGAQAVSFAERGLI
jgi:DNA repair protein RadC